jgi:hypothetical protein
MTMTHQEAQATLSVLEKLIRVAEGLGAGDGRQRAALHALRGRRSNLRRIVAARDTLKQQPVVCLKAWRETPRLVAAAAL